MKVQLKQLDNTKRVEILDALYTAAGTVHGHDAMKKFLRGLLTESERVMLGRRILIAKDLLSRKTYDEIVTERGVGRDTIMRIARWLDEQMPGYEEAIAEMEEEFVSRKKKAEDKKLYATSAIHRLRKKYPMHFLLFPSPKLKK